jgi:PAS domain S-box-containing protein
MKFDAEDPGQGGGVRTLGNGGHLVICLLFAFLLSLIVAFGQTAQPRTIRVVLENHPPFAFTDDRGQLAGILVDEWRLWEKQTGIKAELVVTDLGEALRRMQAGEFDVIDSISKTPERAEYLEFSKPYAQLGIAIFFRKDVDGIKDLDSIKGFPIAAKAGDAAADLLKERGLDTVLLFADYKAVIDAARQRRVNVFVMDSPPALFFLNKLGVGNEFRQSSPVNSEEFDRAVRKGNEALLKTVEDGFAAIAPAEVRRIEAKWLGKSLGSGPNLRYLGYAAVAGLVIILGMALWNLALNRLVKVRTAALRESESRLRTDITERVQAEADLRRMNRTLRMLTECNEAVVRAADEPELLQAICRLAVESGGYRMAWVGFAEMDPARTVRPVAQAGVDQGYLEAARVTWDESERGRGPTGTAIRTGQSVIARNILTDPAFSPWRQAALERGYAASATLPFKRNGSVIGALSVYAAEPGTFNADEVALLTELSDDVAYGITALRIRVEHQRIEEALHASEKKFRSIFENAPVGIFQSTVTGRLLSVNLAGARMFGYDSPAGLLATATDIPQQLFLSPGQRERVVQDALRSDTFVRREVEYRRRDSTVFAANLYMRAVRDADGNVAMVEGFVEDITEQKRAEQALRKSRERARALAARLQSLREEERTHLARELHDHLGQLLTALKFDLHALDRKIPHLAESEVRSGLSSKVASARELTDEVTASVQKIASELRSGVLDRLGLVAALETELEAFQTRTGIACRWRLPSETLTLTQDQANGMFRIFQETMTNIARHAHATETTVELTLRDGNLVLEVNDNGIGILQKDIDSSQSLGLVGMQERAAILGGQTTFKSGSGVGTTVTVTIPLQRKAEYYDEANPHRG